MTHPATDRGPATTVGIIYPGHAAEQEYPATAAALGVDLPVTHVYGTDLHAVPELLDLGSPARLREGAAALAAHRPRAVMWACTSGSFVYGHDGARAQVADLAAAAGVPASSTSLAFLAALDTLALTRVAVAASYPDDVAELFAEFLTAGGARVVAMGSAGIVTAAQVGTLSPERVLELAVAGDHPDAQAVLVPDTAMHTIALLPELERRLGKPVLTANQVTIWQGLLLAGHAPASPVLGSLVNGKQDHARR